MIFAIDIGNTNIVIGCFSDSKVIFTERLSTKTTSTALEYAVSFKNVLELYNITPENIEGAIISSVVPDITNVIQNAIHKITGKDSLIVGPGIKTGLSIKVDNPAQLGSDLVVGAVAALKEYSAPLAIIDFGTATTITVINSKKELLGGMIMPGLMLSMKSLASGTSQLPKISLDTPGKFIGTNTVDCMKSGILYSTAYGMDGIIEGIEKELGEKVNVVATGGLAKVIVPLCKSEITVDDELLLKGLMEIYNRNR